jgi:hypothetical protein
VTKHSSFRFSTCSSFSSNGSSIFASCTSAGKVINGIGPAYKGYFSKRKGEKGYQLSICATGTTGDVLVHTFTPGNHSAPSDFIDLVYGAAEALGSFTRLGIICADAAYGTAPNLDFLIEQGLLFVIKGRNPKSFTDMIPVIPPAD